MSEHTTSALASRETTVKSAIKRLESALIAQKLRASDIETNAHTIHHECQQIGLEELVRSPYLLALWSRAQFAQGRYFEALRLSRVTRDLLATAHSHDVTREQLMLEARAYLALSQIDNARAAYASARELVGEDPRQLFEIELLCARLCSLEGEFSQAHEALNRARGLKLDFTRTFETRLAHAHLEMMEAGECSEVDGWIDVESVDAKSVEVAPEVRRLYGAARLMMAHRCACEGQSLRARELARGTEDVSSLYQPLRTLVQSEIALLEGDAVEAYEMLVNSESARTCELCVQELFEYYWVKALAVFAQCSLHSFIVEATRLVELVKGVNSSFMRRRAHLLAALALYLAHDNSAAQRHVEAAQLTETMSASNDAVTSLLAYLCSALEARDAESLESFFSSRAADYAGDVTQNSACLLAVALAHSHPLLRDFILKNQLRSGGAQSFIARLCAHDDLAPTQYGVLTEEEWSMVQRGAALIQSERPAQRASAGSFHISLFGTLEVAKDGVPLALPKWGKNKMREIFIALALSAGSDFATDELFERLWPGKSLQNARNGFYVAWCQLKRRLIDADSSFADLIGVRSAGGRGYLNTEICTVDAVEFERLARRGRMLRANHQEKEALEVYTQAAQLYRGDLLPGDTHLEWLDLPREHFHTLFLETMIAAAEICLDQDDPARAILFIEDALHVEHSREKLYELAMRAYALAGRREDAIRAYVRCKTYVSEELGLDPSPAIKQLYVDLIRA